MKTSSDKSLVKEASLLSLSNLMNSASNGLIIVLLNKFLPSSESGVFLFLLSIASPLFVFISFDLRRKITANQTDGYSNSQIFAFRNIAALTGVIFFVLASAILNKWNPVFYLALFCIAFGKMADSISEINYAIFQKYNKEVYILASRSFKFLGCLALFVFKPDSYRVIFLMFLLGNIIPLFFFEFWKMRSLKTGISFFSFSLSYKDVKILVLTNISLAVASLIMALSPNIPVYFVKLYMSIDSVTYFSSINFIVSTMYLTGSGMGYAMLKKMGGQQKNHKKDINMIVKASLFSLASYIVIGILFYLSNGLVLIFNANYESFYGLLYLLLASGFLFTLCSYLNNYLLYLNAKSIVFKLRTARIIVNILVCGCLPLFSLSLNMFGICLIVTNLFDCLTHVYFIVRSMNALDAKDLKTNGPQEA